MILTRKLTIKLKAKFCKSLHAFWRRLRPKKPPNPAVGMTDCSSLDINSIPSLDRTSSVVAEAGSDRHESGLNSITTAQKPFQDSHDPIHTILAIDKLLHGPQIDIDPIVKPVLLAARADLKRFLSLDIDMEELKEVLSEAIHLRKKCINHGPLSNEDYRRVIGIFGPYWVQRARIVYKEKVRALEGRIDKLKDALVGIFWEMSRGIAI